MTAAAHRITGLRFPDGTNAPSGVFNIKDPLYGATGDGTTDDTTAIQAAYTAAAVKGGTVYWPSSNGERYTLTSSVTASSIYPINSIGDMHGYCDNQATGAFIRPGANFAGTAMIKYVAPGGVGTAHGGGLIRGLSFYDNTNTNHTTNYTMLAALDLTDFNFGKVENCMFHVLNGGAVRAINWVMGSMSKCVVRYCGTGSQAAVSLEPTALGGVQSTSLYDLKIEANYGTYLKLNSNCNEVKLSHLGFESLPSAPTTFNTFVDNSGQKTFASDIHMNRNSATHWINQAASNFTVAENLIINGDTNMTSNPAMVINGANHQFTGVSITGLTAQTTYSLSVTGAFCILNGIEVNTSGGISISGNSFVLLSNAYVNAPPSGAGTSAIDITSSECEVSGGIIRGLPANMNGVRLSGAVGASAVIGVEVRDQTGTGAAFVDNNSNNSSTWIANRSTNSSTSFTATATSYCARGNTWGGVETETIQGNLKINGTVQGFVMASGQVIDSNNTLNIGVTASTATSIGKTGTVTTVNNSLKSNQGLASTFRSAATPVTMAKTDYFVGVSGSGARAVTLPAASACMIGQQFIVQDIGASAGVITITRAGSDTINGGTSFVMSATAYARQILICDGVSAFYADTLTTI